MDLDFDYHIQKALEALPQEFREKLDNVGIFVEDYPSEEQIAKYDLRKEKMMLLGLYEGIPKTKRANYGVGATLPDKITLFKYPILSVASTQSELIKQIKATLYHEIGHHFGMSEEQIRKATKKE